MKISEMLRDRNTKPMQIVAHKDFSRASWLLHAATYKVEDMDGRETTYRHDTPLDAILRDSCHRTAQKLAGLGL